uniref:Putative atp synthase subunit h n=1 Tax=Ixodes ricinus TaxID=34613 RepID=V5H8Z3_IXORI
MAADVAPVAIVSVFWVIVGAIVPWFIPKGSQRGTIQSMLVITSISCYMFWLCTYMSQIVPVGGPQPEQSHSGGHRSLLERKPPDSSHLYKVTK